MSRAKLLVVEDEPNLLMGIRDMLQLDDYAVMTASNGVEALEVLENSNGTMPDMIVSDIMMPKMDGYRFFEEVRKRPDWGEIPFIFLTAKGEKSDVQRSRRLGVHDHLVKPFEAEDLLLAVHQRLKIQESVIGNKIDALEQLKRRILTILNHEFRTPLTIVAAYSEMVKENSDRMQGDSLQSLDVGELRFFLNEINTGASRLRHLIENFILLVELETGDAAKNYTFWKGRVEDFGVLIGAVVDRFQNDERYVHQCEASIESDLPAITGHGEYLNVMLSELLLNAAKFSPPDKPISLDAYSTAESVCVRVTDQGRGIAADELEVIWDKFYQIDRDQFEDQGAGSGLAIVKGLAELHEAEVRVESTVGEGSSFSLIFPRV
jgi:two-component system, sensor histidine kinase and response regulator